MTAGIGGTRDSVRILETFHPHLLASVVGSAVSELSWSAYAISSLH